MGEGWSGEGSGMRGRQRMQYSWAQFWQRGEGKVL